jgi:vancomycin resistance protein YoaR
MIAVVVAAAVVLLVLIDVGLSWGRVLPGVRVGDLDIGGMSPTATQIALEQAFQRAAERPVTVRWGEKSFQIKGADIGAQLDATTSVAAALAVGRSGGIARIVTDRFRAVFGGVVMAPAAQADASATAAALDRIDAAAAQPAQDASVAIRGFSVSVVPSRPGRALDRRATLAAVLAAFMDQVRTIDAVVTTVQPSVSDAAAEGARQQAVSLASGPVVVTFQGASVTVPRATVARCIVFVRDASVPAGPAPITMYSALSASLDATRMAPAVATLTKGRVRAAKDASFVADKGSVRLIPSQVGTGPDLGALARDLVRACLSGRARTAVLRLVVTQPRLTTASARRMGIADRISTFTTSYSTANPARTNNVHLLAKALDGKLVAPGAVFSFNGAAGQRTAAKGYQEAPAIVEGKLVPQLGGGVCQVGTTIFNTVFFSGLPIVERHNHSFYISHYPTGRDATVSWGGPDFKFRNDTGSWLLIRTAVTASTLTISLYGTDPGYDVRYTTGAFTDIVPFKTQEITDSKLKKGARVIVDSGDDGRTVVVTRTVYKGGTVVRTDSFVSHYSPKTQVVRVGTKVSTTPTPTVSP